MLRGAVIPWDYIGNAGAHKEEACRQFSGGWVSYPTPLLLAPKRLFNYVSESRGASARGTSRRAPPPAGRLGVPFPPAGLRRNQRRLALLKAGMPGTGHAVQTSPACCSPDTDCSRVRAKPQATACPPRSKIILHPHNQRQNAPPLLKLMRSNAFFS